jgi:hypothetical protein
MLNILADALMLAAQIQPPRRPEDPRGRPEVPPSVQPRWEAPQHWHR